MPRNYEEVLKEDIEEHHQDRYDLEKFFRIDISKEEFYEMCYMVSCKGAMLICAATILSLAKQQTDKSLRQSFGKISSELYKVKESRSKDWLELQLDQINSSD